MNVDGLLELSLSELARLEPDSAWSLGTRVATACLLEAAAPKAGNVHPHIAFEDMSYEDFRLSAKAIGPVFDNRSNQRVGELVLQAIEATQQVVSVNTNLGIVLLLAPLAIASLRAVRSNESSPSGRNEADAMSLISERTSTSNVIRSVLHEMNSHDCQQVYSAIQLAKAGGMGKVQAMDIHATPPDNLLDAMRLASAWDDIAKQYISDFQEVFAMSERLIELRKQFDGHWFGAICRLQIERLAQHGDTLIARKNDPSVVEETKRLAKLSLDASDTTQAYNELDIFLRANGHRRNPGTTADLLAAATFMALSDQR